MLIERYNGIIEELSEVESLPELKAIWCNWVAEAPECADNADIMAALRKRLPEVRLMNHIQDMVAEVVDQPKPPVARGPRTDRKYVLLSTDVSWSTKPQVHALMAILSANLRVGEQVPESVIVGAVVANEKVLNTRQGGRRIWDYYKGEHTEGLAAHGNVQKV